VPLRDRLATDFAIPKAQVVISTGQLDELKDIPDVSSPRCPVRIVITVQKLREGWDCPFAYVLCSLRETHSATAMEQIVGRVLRLPNAEKKRHPDLNCAYAYSVSASMPEVLNELRGALESNGFTPAEAERVIIPESRSTLPLGVRPVTVQLDPGAVDAQAAGLQAPALLGKATVNPESNRITIFAPLNKEDTARLTSCLVSAGAKAQVEAAIVSVHEMAAVFAGVGAAHQPSPFEQGVSFVVPLLCVQESATLLDFDSTLLIDHAWRLSEKDASLPETYNPLARPTAQAGVIDITEAGAVQTTEVRDRPDKGSGEIARQETLLLEGAEKWTLENLVVWLDHNIDHRDIPLSESAPFLLKVVQGLMARFGLSNVAPLVVDRARLRDTIENRIQDHRLAESKSAFQRYLFPQSPLAVTEQHAIDFSKIDYAPSSFYDGTFQFQKHYFGSRPGNLDELTKSGALTEEFRCAQFIDHLPEVRFWVRNIPRRPTSFRLQTSTDFFYPDFLCLLMDGRILAVEYKGTHIYGAADAEEKKAIGAVWASRSSGRCLFVMPAGGDFGAIVSAVSG
jgi:type III restriction enzyme